MYPSEGCMANPYFQTEDIQVEEYNLKPASDYVNATGLEDDTRKPLHTDTVLSEPDSTSEPTSPSGKMTARLRRSKSASLSQLTGGTAMADFTFHSPSKIIGTPFEIGPSPFEYPFPRGSSPTTSEPHHTLSTSLPSAPLLPPHHPVHSHSLPPVMPTWVPLVSQPFSLKVPPPFKRNSSPAHSKLRATVIREPPIPPGLAKKRQEFNANFQTRRMSDQSVQTDFSRRDEVPRGRRSSFSLGLADGDLLPRDGGTVGKRSEPEDEGHHVKRSSDATSGDTIIQESRTSDTAEVDRKSAERDGVAEPLDLHSSVATKYGQSNPTESQEHGKKHEAILSGLFTWVLRFLWVGGVPEGTNKG